MEVFWFLLSSIIAGLAALICFFYHMKKGQFDEMEDVKYQIFHEEND